MIQCMLIASGIGLTATNTDCFCSATLAFVTRVEFELLRESFGDPEVSVSRVPSGAMRHLLCVHEEWALCAKTRTNSRNDLVPIADGLEFELVATTKVSIQVLLWDQLQEVRVETHLGR